MKKYNKFYFLHIPKTGGRFFAKYILDPIENILKENSIEIIKAPATVLNHAGWHKDIDDSTYIVTLFRDPLEFFVSVVSHIEYDHNYLLDKEDEHVVKKDSLTLEISKETLHEQLKNLKSLKNFQSQNFVLSPKYESTIKESKIAYKQNKKFDEELAYKRIKRVNLMIRQKDLKSMNYSKLIQKLSKDLEINIDIDLSFIDMERYKNNGSELLFNKLNKEDIEMIYNHFLFDKKIYEDDSLFWN